MIAQLRGCLLDKTVEQVVLDVQGVGYQVAIPLSTYYALPALQETVTLLTTLYVREDALRLYGFMTRQERSVFELLISVSSIGPRLALNMLSSLTATALQQAIAQGETARLQAIPGIGRKTAERLVLELQDKMAMLETVLATTIGDVVLPADDQVVHDVISALINLGYKRPEAERAVQSVRKAQSDLVTLEPLLKEALQRLAR